MCAVSRSSSVNMISAHSLGGRELRKLRRGFIVNGQMWWRSASFVHSKSDRFSQNEWHRNCPKFAGAWWNDTLFNVQFTPPTPVRVPNCNTQHVCINICSSCTLLLPSVIQQRTAECQSQSNAVERILRNWNLHCVDQHISYESMSDSSWICPMKPQRLHSNLWIQNQGMWNAFPLKKPRLCHTLQQHRQSQILFW